MQHQPQANLHHWKRRTHMGLTKRPDKTDDSREQQGPRSWQVSILAFEQALLSDELGRGTHPITQPIPDLLCLLVEISGTRGPMICGEKTGRQFRKPWKHVPAAVTGRKKQKGQDSLFPNLYNEHIRGCSKRCASRATRCTGLHVE
jgi:hypothetical protein